MGRAKGAGLGLQTLKTKTSHPFLSNSKPILGAPALGNEVDVEMMMVLLTFDESI